MKRFITILSFLLAAGSVLSLCIDTDGGRNYYQQSFIGTQYWNSTEQCQGNYILESYCNNQGNLTQESYLCPNGCRDGACIPYSCVDTDGRNKSVKGYVSYAGKRYEDNCRDSQAVNEYVCLQSTGTDPAGSGVFSFVIENCPNGCVNGSCVSCIESWQCSAWSACSGGQQTRSCSDTNPRDIRDGDINFLIGSSAPNPNIIHIAARIIIGISIE